jgi:hypothetical protein
MDLTHIPPFFALLKSWGRTYLRAHAGVNGVNGIHGMSSASVRTGWKSAKTLGSLRRLIKSEGNGENVMTIFFVREWTPSQISLLPGHIGQ